MRVTLDKVANQEQALRKLAELAQRSALKPIVRETALAIVADCAARDDECEIGAVFEAVKHGTPRVRALRRGFKYVADARYADQFFAPHQTLAMCARGACGSDCDDHTTLQMALGAALGFRMGARAWAPRGGGDFEHVYAVAALPKRPPYRRIVAMDTTVDESYLGWEPPRGRILSAWIE